jgi:hypothetical protein
MHAGHPHAAARLNGYSHAFIVYPSVTLHDFRFKAQRVTAIGFVQGQWNDEINGLTDPSRPLRTTDR